MSADTVGGVWTYALDLARGLRPHGVDVVLATMGEPVGAEGRREAEAAGIARIHESRFRLEWMEDPWEDVEQAGEWLLRLAGEEAVDLVHLSSYAHAALPWERPVVSVGHSCVLSWWSAVRGGDPPARLQTYGEAVARGLAAADAVVAPTRAMLGELERIYGVGGGLAIHNGSSAPEAEGVVEKEPWVLAAGRLWDEAKNLAALDRAAEGLPWPVRVAGELGTARPAHAEALGRLAPAQLEPLRRRASIFAAPARYEPFGLAPLEAARAGCALVLGDIPSLREVWGDAALYVDPDEPAALHEALRRLMEDPQGRARLGRRARLRSRRYTTEAMASSYARLYQRVGRPAGVAA